MNALTGLVEQIKKCESAGATMPAVAMAYVAIDVLAYLGLPNNRETQGRADFIEWVDKYLKGHHTQPYQYRGIDVYGARCAVLHAFSAEADFHKKNEQAKVFAYHDGGQHTYNAAENERLVIVGTASLINDVILGIGSFLENCKADKDLSARVLRRLPNLLATFPFPATSANG
jgi:hypothetical protein